MTAILSRVFFVVSLVDFCMVLITKCSGYFDKNQNEKSHETGEMGYIQSNTLTHTPELGRVFDTEFL